ncbi:MAG TPA: XRE family transcriptional regulator [Pirellulales bacterium]|nr:XRE family transcriptional regulator [Pirellulales bacterium]
MAKSFDALVRRTTTKRTRERAAARTKELLGELLVSELRRAAGKSQRQVAQTLGIKQPSVAKLEKQTDMQISTLRKIVNALGGELEVVARFPRGAVKIGQFGEARRNSSGVRKTSEELQLF